MFLKHCFMLYCAHDGISLHLCTLFTIFVKHSTARALLAHRWRADVDIRSIDYLTVSIKSIFICNLCVCEVDVVTSL